MQFTAILFTLFASLTALAAPERSRDFVFRVPTHLLHCTEVVGCRPNDPSPECRRIGTNAFPPFAVLGLDTNNVSHISPFVPVPLTLHLSSDQLPAGSCREVHELLNQSTSYGRGVQYVSVSHEYRADNCLELTETEVILGFAEKYELKGVEKAVRRVNPDRCVKPF